MCLQGLRDIHHVTIQCEIDFNNSICICKRHKNMELFQSLVEIWKEMAWRQQKSMFYCIRSSVCFSLNITVTPFVLFLRSQLLSGHLPPWLQVLCRPRPHVRLLDPHCVLLISHTSFSFLLLCLPAPLCPLSYRQSDICCFLRGN